MPDAIILEGPKSGGHLGFTKEQSEKEEYQLENLFSPCRKELDKWDKDIPLIVAGGIWDYKDIEFFKELGADGVQIGSRFIVTEECDSENDYKELLINSKKEDIVLIDSPVGMPARIVKTNICNIVENKNGPKVKCISDCVSPCNNGKKSKEVGYCIADSCRDSFLGNMETGIYFAGSESYRADKIITVKELLNELTGN